jgi:hypothetical protein
MLGEKFELTGNTDYCTFYLTQDKDVIEFMTDADCPRSFAVTRETIIGDHPFYELLNLVSRRFGRLTGTLKYTWQLPGY